MTEISCQMSNRHTQHTDTHFFYRKHSLMTYTSFTMKFNNFAQCPKTFLRFGFTIMSLFFSVVFTIVQTFDNI